MTLEEAIFAALGPLVDGRCFPDVAPLSTAKPYITYQVIGGPNTRWLDGSAPDKRRSIVQINAWGARRLQVNTLARAIEDALCASTEVVAQPDAEPRSDHDDTELPDAPLGLFGTVQDFSVISNR